MGGKCLICRLMLCAPEFLEYGGGYGYMYLSTCMYMYVNFHCSWLLMIPVAIQLSPVGW